MTDAMPSLEMLRRQVAALLSQIDTATLPRPDKIHGRRHDRPGSQWDPGKGWRVFTIDRPDSAGFVYLDHVCDDLNYRWGEPDEWEAMRIEDARRLGLALLAAAARADELFVGVSRLPAPGPLGDMADGPDAEVRPMQRGGRR